VHIQNIIIHYGVVIPMIMSINQYWCLLKTGVGYSFTLSPF